MYQVLYRKYRSKTFDDVYGQDNITTILKNEVKSGRTSHAYLFTGTRGTGKTSCAKIIAKAVNCLNPHDGNPCNECAICKGIDDGSIMDVVEIDAASNNGVNDIRDIREESVYTPAVCKYKVYIIDEVHMLSTGAFNALLKTLEEPPSHVIFVLATTEVHKLPNTILSRCQRFDFKRIAVEDIVARINYISEKEGITIDEPAAKLIAKLADGGMRDAVSLLDQCAGNGTEITTDVVVNTAGMASMDDVLALADSIANSNATATATGVANLYNNAKDMSRLCEELINIFRDAMVVKSVDNYNDLIVGTEGYTASIKKLSESMTLTRIMDIISSLQVTTSKLPMAFNKRVTMEMAVIKLSSPEYESSSQNSASSNEQVERLQRRIDMLEQKLKKGTFTSNVNQPASVTPKDEQPSSSTPPVSEDESAGTSADTEIAKWPEILEELSKISKPLWGVLGGSKGYIRGDIVLVDTDNTMFRNLVRGQGQRANLVKAIESILGKQYRIGFYKRPQAETVSSSEDPLNALEQSIAESGVEFNIK